MRLLRRLKTAALDSVRHGRNVAWCPEWMNLGNLLYMGLWASEGQRDGEDRFVLAHPTKDAALALFPTAREQLFLSPSQVRFFDRRVSPWSGRDEAEADRFENAHLDNYVLKQLLPSSPVSVRPPDISSATLVVNVRRGDYFSVSENLAEYGIDTLAYTLCAVEKSIRAGGTPRDIAVVSDDLAWCRAHLEPLQEFAPTRYRDGGIAEDLSALVHAERIIIPNSTFSYWGGYLGDALNPGRQVIAPWFFNRTKRGGKAGQLRPQWTRIDEIPGGWGEPSQ